MKKLDKHTRRMDFIIENDLLSEIKDDVFMEDIKDIKISLIEIPYTQIPPRILYELESKTEGEVIDTLATRIGRIENKSIRLLIEEYKLCNVIRDFLSAKEIDEYFRKKAILSQLLKNVVKCL